MINKHIQRLRTAEDGFDLVQALVVVVILGALATIAVLTLLPQLTKGDTAAAEANLASGVRAAQIYQADNGGSDAAWADIEGTEGLTGIQDAAAYVEEQTNNTVTATPTDGDLVLSSTEGSVTKTATVAPSGAQS